MAEQPPCKRQVAGSIPATGSTAPGAHKPSHLRFRAGREARHGFPRRRWSLRSSAKSPQRRRPGHNPKGSMLPSPGGTYWRSSNFRRRVLQPAYLASGWRGADGKGRWTWHSLRHVFCTTALSVRRLDAPDLSRLLQPLAGLLPIFGVSVGAGPPGGRGRAPASPTVHPAQVHRCALRAKTRTRGGATLTAIKPCAGQPHPPRWLHEPGRMIMRARRFAGMAERG